MCLLLSYEKDLTGSEKKRRDIIINQMFEEGDIQMMRAVAEELSKKDNSKWTQSERSFMEQVFSIVIQPMVNKAIKPDRVDDKQIKQNMIKNNIKASYMIMSFEASMWVNMLGLSLNNGVDDVKKWFLSFIPQKISNEGVVSVYQNMRYNLLCFGYGLQKISFYHNTMTQDEIDTHYYENRRALQDTEIFNTNRYIENQRYWGKIQFGTGKSNMSYSGCEIIATANALKSLGEIVSSEDMAELIRNFEEDGMVYNGQFGTSPIAISDYFELEGYTTVTTTSTNANEINNIGENSDTVVVTAYNDKEDISQEIHTVNISKTEDRKYVIHNSYLADLNDKFIESDEYSSLSEAIAHISRNNNSKSIMVIGISKSMIGDFPENDANFAKLVDTKKGVL